jgi:signal transduction histidine kinase/ActR/RegA family two-component response regulator
VNTGKPAAMTNPSESDLSKRSADAAMSDQIAALRQKLKQQEAHVSAAEKKLHMQDQLMATVAHELRTQMGAVMNLVEILAETDLDPNQHTYAKSLKGSTTGLLRVLNDVLDHGKFESGKFELVCQNFSPRDLVDTVIETLIVPCQTKGLALRLEVGNDLPEQLYGDPLRIRQILSNLANNAVKFTERGSIDVSLSASCLTGETQLLEIAVKDTGIGLDEALKDQLFTPYQQADAQISSQYGGTGLGLSICRQLVMMMGGDIGYSSKRGHGSSFWFNVKCKPYQVDADGKVGEEQGLSDVLALEKQRHGHILIVEDNKTNQMLISTYLEKFDHTFEIAGSGEDALEVLKTRKFDVILMDVIMTGMDGMDTTRHIRKTKGYARTIPIIALTANAMAGDRQKYLDAGMDAYISKPINAAELFHAIDKALINVRAVA